MLNHIISYYSSFKSETPNHSFKKLIDKMKSNSRLFLYGGETYKSLFQSGLSVSDMGSFNWLNRILSDISNFIYSEKELIMDLNNIKNSNSITNVLLKYVDNVIDNYLDLDNRLVSRHSGFIILSNTLIDSIDDNNLEIVILVRNYFNGWCYNNYFQNISQPVLNENTLITSPLKCIMNDSLQYNIYLKKWKLTYDYMISDYPIFLLDIRSLLYSYLGYTVLKQKQDKYVSKLSKEDYSKWFINFVILPWVYLNQDNYLFSIINEYIQYSLKYKPLEYSFSIKDVFISMIDPRFSYMKNYLSDAYTEFIHMLKKVSNGNIQVNSMLRSIPIIGTKRINTYIEAISGMFPIENTNKSELMILLKDQYFINMLLDLYSLSSNPIKYNSLSKTIGFSIRKYTSNKLWNLVNQSSFKDHIQYIIMNLNEKIK